ncbi:MAG: diguanylate cyclase, partial [Armatimonadetes bacterium]|nr:diguanylate cyclase [Armatimonadota bacterium]
LLKPGPLDAEEFAKMQNHAAIGANLLRHANMPDDVVDMVLYHHEKHDGTGYPERLSGEDIPLGSRIIAVAVVYDALISDRCYRSGWSHSDAVAHLQELSGSSFDPKVVEAFRAVEPQVLRIRAEDFRDKNSSNGNNRESSCAAVDTIAQANRELISLFDIAQTLSSTLEINEVLALLAHRTRRLVQGSTCVVFMADKTHSKSLVAEAAVGRFEEVFEGARARYGKGITGSAAQKAQPRSGHYDPGDLVLKAAEAASDLDFKSCVSAPKVRFGEVLGTINVYDVCRRSFTDDELRVLTFVAHQAALAVQNARAFEEARDYALRDPLTNLRNGRFLQHYLDRELSRCFRFDEPLSVLGIDLDNFKGINDLRGHEAGDKALKDVADIFRRELRDYDVIVRNGGDEFVAVLPEMDSCRAHQIADRIKESVDQYARKYVRDVPQFGASIGVSTYPIDGEDTCSLLGAADAAMYRDKRARRRHRKAA